MIDPTPPLKVDLDLTTKEEEDTQINDSITNESTPYSDTEQVDSPFYDSDADPEYLPETSDSGEESLTSVRTTHSASIPVTGEIVFNDDNLSNAVDELKNLSNLPAPFTKSPVQLKQSRPQRVANETSKRIRQKDFCFYCETFILNFARHVTRNHSLEIEVQRILSLPVKSKERKYLLTTLRKKGNYLINFEECTKPMKKPELKSLAKYLPCVYCLGFYSAKQLYRHRKRCSENPGCNSNNAQSDAQNYLVRNLQIDQQLREIVFPHMRADHISLVAKKDTLICAFGTRYMKIHREKHFVNVTSRKMRELSKLLIEVMKFEPSIKSLFQALQPQHFDLFVQATKNVGKYDSEKDLFLSPTYAMNIVTSLKQCCDIALMYVIKKNDLCASIQNGDAVGNLKNMKELLHANWRFEISSQAATDLSLQKWNKVTIVPLASDLKLFRQYLKTKGDSAASNLSKDNTDQKAYIELLETVFCRVILLNRKRPGELQRMYLNTYVNIEVGGKNSYEEFDNAINSAEKFLMQKFKRVVAKGKRGRGVPVLFSADVLQHIQLLIAVRDNFLDRTNLYLFGKPKLNSPINGYKVLEKYAKACGAKNPSALTSTRLRKHLATLSQIFNMSETEIEQLATFMGHTTGIHKRSYRLPDDVYQTAKISKLLLLMEKGTAAEYKGKALDEIALNLDDDLLADTLGNEDEGVANDMDAIEGYIETPEVPGSTTVENNIKVVNANGSSRKTKKSKKRELVPWTEEEKSAVNAYFKTHIANKRPPKKHECEDLIEKHPHLLHNKTWLKIKVYVQNKYTKKLK